jgi:hypothetical protein
MVHDTEAQPPLPLQRHGQILFRTLTLTRIAVPSAQRSLLGFVAFAARTANPHCPATAFPDTWVTRASALVLPVHSPTKRPNKKATGWQRLFLLHIVLKGLPRREADLIQHGEQQDVRHKRSLAEFFDWLNWIRHVIDADLATIQVHND